MRVLGIDLGLRRSGLAVSDEMGIAVRILPNLIEKNQRDVMEKIISYIAELNIGVVIIGSPAPKTTASKTIARRATSLKEQLLEVLPKLGLNVAVYLQDEAMTSKRGLAYLISLDVGQKKRREMLDGAAAAMMVEDFLAWSGKS
jgi:putative holliday junction resolvase